MKSMQLSRLELLLIRRKGCTGMEISREAGTTSPHRRLTDLKQRGWTIVRKPVKGENYGTYHGIPPMEFS